MKQKSGNTDDRERIGTRDSKRTRLVESGHHCPRHDIRSFFGAPPHRTKDQARDDVNDIKLEHKDESDTKNIELSHCTAVDTAQNPTWIEPARREPWHRLLGLRHRCNGKARNIIDQLDQRSQRGSRIHAPLRMSWSPCPWLSLQLTAPPTCMVWDSSGSLLLIGTTENRLCLWEWDTVVASDLRGRKDNRRDLLRPVCTFVLSYVPDQLSWSSDDVVAVSFRGIPQLNLYQLDINDNPNHGNQSHRTGHHPGPYVLNRISSCKPTRDMAAAIAPNCHIFLDKRNLVAAFPDGSVVRYRLIDSSTSAQQAFQAKVVWRWKAEKEVVLSMYAFGSSWVLLGGRKGSLIWLDWKTTKRKSFSNERIPSVLSRIDVVARLRSQKQAVPPLSSSVWMSVQSIHIRQPHPTVFPLLTECVVWCTTRSGWVLSLDLGKPNRGTIHVRHKPPLIRTASSTDGNLISTKQSSLPLDNQVSCHQSQSGICVALVPQVTRILPHHDQRVLEERETVRSPKRGIVWIDRLHRTMEVHTKSTPGRVVVHPSGRWLVAEMDHKCSIFCATRATKAAS